MSEQNLPTPEQLHQRLQEFLRASFAAPARPNAAENSEETPAEPKAHPVFQFKLTPRDIKVEYAKQNVVLVGPTGVGKTYLVKHVADLVGVPFVKADATKFSETGYVGGDVEDLVRELVHKADGDLELAQYGIIYIDEIDKIATSSNISGRDVSGRGVQTTLLKL